MDEIYLILNGLEGIENSTQDQRRLEVLHVQQSKLPTQSGKDVEISENGYCWSVDLKLLLEEIRESVHNPESVTVVLMKFENMDQVEDDEEGPESVRRAGKYLDLVELVE